MQQGIAHTVVVHIVSDVVGGGLGNRVFEAAIVSKDVVAIVNADVAFHNIISGHTQL